MATVNSASSATATADAATPSVASDTSNNSNGKSSSATKQQKNLMRYHATIDMSGAPAKLTIPANTAKLQRIDTNEMIASSDEDDLPIHDMVQVASETPDPDA